MRLRCIYAGGRPLPDAKVLLLRGCRLAKVVVIVGNEYYAFAFKEEAEEFLKQKLGIDSFEVKPCQE